MKEKTGSCCDGCIPDLGALILLSNEGQTDPGDASVEEKAIQRGSTQGTVGQPKRGIAVERPVARSSQKGS